MTHNSGTSSSGGRERRGVHTQWPGFSKHYPRKRDRWSMEVTQLCEFERRSINLRFLPQMGERGIGHGFMPMNPTSALGNRRATGAVDSSSWWVVAQLCKSGGRHTALKLLSQEEDEAWNVHIHRKCLRPPRTSSQANCWKLFPAIASSLKLQGELLFQITEANAKLQGAKVSAKYDTK